MRSGAAVQGDSGAAAGERAALEQQESALQAQLEQVKGRLAGLTKKTEQD
jgi:uncharacterized protein involved in exopolysaccharide biosynthesis